MSQMFSQAEGLISNGEFLKKAHDLSLGKVTVKNNKKIEYYNLPAAFDIEVSSFYQGAKLPENKRAIMYIWQFGINNLVTTGRTWGEFIAFISVLKKAMNLSLNRRLVVYVHNLPYEFQFIRKHFKWQEVFILKEKKPVYCTTIDGIEFRCSLKLAGGKSLANVGKDLVKYKVKKMEGYLDYNQIRTPLTPLTPKELKYCENDIRVLLSYIQEKIEQDGDITRIPLTNTGYVREYCRKACYKRWKPYRRIIENLTLEPDEYSQLKRAFQGGFTHANAKYVNQTLSKVRSHDFNSSYPGVMVTEKYPMSKAELISDNIDEDTFRQLLLTHCCLFDIEFFNIEPIRFNDHPISRYKCWGCEKAIFDNGRVVLAEYIGTTITEQDFFIYLDFYTWERYNVKNLRIYQKAYLPKQFVLSILELYRRKTELKGVKEEYINYMISKNMANASFGMSVTDPVRDEIVYDDSNEYHTNPPNIAEAIEKYNKNIRRFLFYPWGVWITAYARANLFSGIAEMGDDYIYADTDSIKSLNAERHKEYFDRYNIQLIQKIQKAADYHHLDISLFTPKTKKGKEKIIGVWDDEGEYENFKTLGAKRYLTFRYEDKTFEDGDVKVQLTEPVFQITLAGANKAKATAYLRKSKSPFENFANGLSIEPEYSGRLTLTYIDEEIEGDIVDMYGTPYHYHELSCIHMEPSEYNLSMSEEFIRYLEGINDFSE